MQSLLKFDNGVSLRYYKLSLIVKQVYYIFSLIQSLFKWYIFFCKTIGNSANVFLYAIKYFCMQHSFYKNQLTSLNKNNATPITMSKTHTYLIKGYLFPARSTPSIITEKAR